MRISTSQAYSTGLRGIDRGQNQLLRLQNQMSSGRRMLTSADDPVAAARALVRFAIQGRRRPIRA
jgi:flagellar hook-associated protein 3 FlgL